MSDDPSSLWYVYIIETDQQTLYTGIAKNIEQRFQEHLAMHEGKPGAKGAKFFRGAQPVQVVYRESLENRSLASKREYAIKKMARAKKLALIRGSIVFS